MVPVFHPRLVNDPFGDPCLYIDVQRERRAILFDLGDIGGLEAAKVMRVSDVFVSHTHIDHFIGFDHLLRLLLGRGKKLRIFGPLVSPETLRGSCLPTHGTWWKNMDSG